MFKTLKRNSAGPREIQIGLNVAILSFAFANFITVMIHYSNFLNEYYNNMIHYTIRKA